jgi:hypothetical protein
MNTPHAHPLYTHSADWITRGIGLLVNTFYLAILTLSLTQNGRPAPQGWPVQACLLVAIAGIFIALRWPAPGGRLAIAGALALIPAVLYSMWVGGLGLQGAVMGLVIYPAPFLITASLFLSGPRAR